MIHVKMMFDSWAGELGISDVTFLTPMHLLAAALCVSKDTVLDFAWRK